MSLNWHSLRHAALWGWHQLLTLALALLVVVAVVVGLGRQFTPAISEYRADIESRLSRAIGVPVHIGRVTGHWQGMTPFFLIESLQLRDPAKPAVSLLHIPRIELRPSLWRSVLALEPRVDLRVRGLDIHLEQLPDGQVRLRELSSLARSDPAAARRAVEMALRQPLLALEDSRLELALQGYPVLQLHQLSLINRNEGARHRLAGEVFLDALRQPVAVNMTLEGDPVDWRKGRLSVWLNVPALQLDAWLPDTHIAGIGLQEVTGGGEFWLHFAQGRLTAVQSRPTLAQAVFSSALGTHVLKGVQGELAWARAADGWRLSAQHLRARLDNVAWPVPSLALHGKDTRLSVAMAGVDVGTATLLGNRLSLPPALAEWLREATPTGVAALGADLVRADDGRWGVRQLGSRFGRVGVHATSRFPGGSNLAGWLHWTPEGALLGLDMRDGRLDLRQVFREPVAVDRLQGVLRLHTSANDWRIESDRLHVWNPDAKGQALLTLNIPRDARASPHLSLLARLTEARVASVWRYVPWPPAGDHTLAWLRRALVAGTVTQGDFLVEGQLRHGADGPPLRQLMRFELQGAGLDYSPGWPALRDLDGVVTIDGRHLRVEARRAALLDGSAGQGLVADIPDLRHARLSVNGNLQSTGPDLMRLFRESPLRTHTATVAETLQLEGPLSGRLTLDIPLSHALPPGTRVAVEAALAGNRLVLPKQGLVASGLQGQVHFSTQDGLTAEGLRGQLLASPVQARISSTVRDDVLQRVQVDLDGSVTAPALRQWLGGVLWEALDGQTRYQARLLIPSGPTPGQLLVSSDMTGMRIKLPSPLGKGVAEPQALRYQSSLGGTEQLARLQLGRQLNAGLVWHEKGLHAALLRLDGASTGWPSRPGIEIEGRVPRLAWAEWQPWVEKFAEDDAGSTARSGAPGLTRLEVTARELEAKGWRLRDARLQVMREAAAWRIAIDNAEVAGALHWPDADAQDMTLAVERLQWPLEGMPEGAASGAMPAMSSSRPVRVRVSGLRLKTYPGMGSMSGQARISPSPYGLRMDELTLETPVARFDGRLDWQWRGGDSTRLRGKAQCEDVADLLTALQFAPSLQSGQARADVDLSWASSPQDMALSGLDGSLRMNIEKGRLLNVNVATSASRVFGLVDLDNLRRRLKGDFSDVLKRGLSFDTVTLSGNVQAGVMPKAVFDLKGPSLSAHGEGRLDLAQQQIDQAFTVNVPVTSAVPLAAAVVAGPLVGGAVAAAELALKKQIQKMTVLHYRVSGRWNDPAVERLGSAPRPGVPAPESSGGRP